jgi:hypothetical protein
MPFFGWVHSGLTAFFFDTFGVAAGVVLADAAVVVAAVDAAGTPADAGLAKPIVTKAAAVRAATNVRVRRASRGAVRGRCMEVLPQARSPVTSTILTYAVRRSPDAIRSDPLWVPS